MWTCRCVWNSNLVSGVGMGVHRVQMHPQDEYPRFFSSLKIAHVVQHATIYHNETTFCNVFSGSCVVFAETKWHLQLLDRHVFRALSASKMHLRSDRPEPRWGSLQRSPDPLAGGEGSRCPFPKNL